MATRTLLPSRWLFGLLGVCLAISTAWADEKAALDNARARRELARSVFESLSADLRSPNASASFDPEKFYRWSCRWLEAERDLSSKKQDRIAAVEFHLKRMKELGKVLKALFQAGAARSEHYAQSEFYRLEAEKWLMEVKGK